MLLAFVMLIAAMLAELLAGNRRLLEETLMRVRRLESDAGSELRPSALGGLRSTGVPSWRPLRYFGHAERSPVKRVEHG